MLIFNTINQIQNAVNFEKSNGKATALVATMGGLHNGHLSLVKLAKKKSDVVIVSIFVNPMQFNQGEDFESYPRPLKNDIKQLKKLGVAMVFIPNDTDIFPNDINNHSKIIVPKLSNILCGKSRPPFFIGIASIVAKLFHVIPADIAIFGKKDYQQLLIIRQMVADLNFPINIIAGDIIREKDGLAMSSRNVYLDKNERKIAPNLYQILLKTKQTLDKINTTNTEKIAIKKLKQLGFEVDYFKVLDQNLENIGNPHIIITAVTLGKTRLIDNLEL